MNAKMTSYFARQIAVQEIGLAGLKKLQSARLAIVGTGGVGSAAAYFLASQGVGHLRLIDQDIVEESNLHRLIGLDHRDLHLPKAESLARKLNSRHPWTETEAVVETVRTGNIRELLGPIDMIIDGTDNFRTRYLLNEFGAENHVPYLFTSAIANQGHLSLFNPPSTPCLECMIPHSNFESAETCETLGVTSGIVGIVGTLAATEAVKRVLEQSTRILGHLLTLDLAGPEFVFTRIARREECRACGSSLSEEPQPDSVVMLCGDNVANVLPETDKVIDLQRLNTKIPRQSVVASSDSVFVYNRKLHRISVFKTGRLLIGNVRTEKDAQQVACEVWNEILS